jgi:two-component system sensor histidine kinase YesM
MRNHSWKDLVHDRLNDMPLRRKLILAFSLLILLAVSSTAGILFVVARNALMDSEKTSLYQSMIQLNSSLDFFLELYMDRTNRVFMNEEMQTIITMRVENLADAIELDRMIQRSCEGLLNDYRYPEMPNTYYYGGTLAYRLYLECGDVAHYGGETLALDQAKDSSWYVALVRETRTFAWEHGLDDDRGHLSLFRRLIDYKDGKTKGVLQVLIPTERIRAVIDSNLPTDMYAVFYLDDELNPIAAAGNTSYHGDDFLALAAIGRLSPGINTVRVGGRQYLAGMLTSSATGWSTLSIAPIERITQELNVVFILAAILVVVAFGLCVFVASQVASLMTKRIAMLVTKARMIGENRLASDIEIDGKDELGELDKQFDHMVLTLQDYIEREFRSKLTMNQVRLELLQEQINPHLLYNTLAMLAHTARKEGNTAVVGISEKLSFFYRGVLSRGNLITTFRDELNMALTYVDLMRFVYNLNVDTEIDFDQTIDTLFSLKLVLQPIVENSIVHGIRPRGQGVIAIHGSLRDGTVDIVVSDDGIGMEPTVVDQLNSLSRGQDQEFGYGVSTVARRILLFFGPEYFVHFESIPEEGTSVHLRLPALDKEQIERIVSTGREQAPDVTSHPGELNTGVIGAEANPN